MSAWLLPIAERAPLRWIVAEQRTAFPRNRAADAARLQTGDAILLYTTRGCFHSPTRDRGRVAGLATVAAPARELTEPVRFDEREFPVGVRLTIELLAPVRGGVVLADHVDEIGASIPNARAWSAYLRRALVPLADADAELLTDLLRPLARPYAELREEYATA